MIASPWPALLVRAIFVLQLARHLAARRRVTLCAGPAGGLQQALAVHDRAHTGNMMSLPHQPAADSTRSPEPTFENAELSRRLEYLEISEVDRQRLRKLAPALTPRADDFVESFYRHLFSFAETAQFLRDPELVERLKQAQKAHLETMLEANWDEAYMARRFRVGDVHAQVGINPQVFLGAYNQYLQFCLRELAGKESISRVEFSEQMLSLQKAVFLDIGLTLEIYFRQATQNLRHALDLIYKANSELRQFAQLTSHDLKTPLATMANLCDEALDEFRDVMPAEASKLIEAGPQSRLSHERDDRRTA